MFPIKHFYVKNLNFIHISVKRADNNKKERTKYIPFKFINFVFMKLSHEIKLRETFVFFYYENGS